jgi:type IV pilus assembly protein PilV
MNPLLSLANRRRARGVTLIEVLVTMVIVAVGLLGLAGMQVRGLSIQKDAHGRALATQLALDIADRMRSNVSNVGDYAFGNPWSASYTAPGFTDCEAATCTPTQQATFDFQRWFARVRGGALPGGWAQIAAVPGTSAWEITMMWVETGFRTSSNLRTALGPNPCPGGTPAEVECIRIRVWP